MQHHKYSLTELNDMVPWEREIYVNLLIAYIKEEKEKRVLQDKKNKHVFDAVSRIISFITVDGASNAALIKNEFITSFPQVDAISIQRL